MGKMKARKQNKLSGCFVYRCSLIIYLWIWMARISDYFWRSAYLQGLHLCVLSEWPSGFHPTEKISIRKIPIRKLHQRGNSRHTWSSEIVFKLIMYRHGEELPNPMGACTCSFSMKFSTSTGSLCWGVSIVSSLVVFESWEPGRFPGFSDSWKKKERKSDWRIEIL